MLDFVRKRINVYLAALLTGGEDIIHILDWVNESIQRIVVDTTNSKSFEWNMIIELSTSEMIEHKILNGTSYSTELTKRQRQQNKINWLGKVFLQTKMLD